MNGIRLMKKETSITICICTYRRPQIALTIASLSSLQTRPDWTVDVVVVDNDVLPSGREVVLSAAKDIPFELTYTHAPASNISIARNACLDAATGDYLAFIDDDETVTSAWLIELFDVAESTRAEAVLGPVKALYNHENPKWMVAGNFHATVPVFVNEKIITGYTCNVLLDRKSEKINDLRFDLKRGKSGGEDTDYFSRLHTRGGSIAYATEAWVEEVVPPSRASLKWLAARKFRSGQTHGAIIVRDNPRLLNRAKEISKALAKAFYCVVACLFTLSSPVGWRRNYLRGALHLGALSSLAGQPEIELYGTSPTQQKCADVRQ
jgi:succinoglycan biosynthesis protein ExoM